MVDQGIKSHDFDNNMSPSSFYNLEESANMKFIVALGLLVLVSVASSASDKDCKKAAKHFARNQGNGNGNGGKVIPGTCQTGKQTIDGVERETFAFDLTFDIMAGMMRTPMACRGVKVYQGDNKLFGTISSFKTINQGQCQRTK